MWFQAVSTSRAWFRCGFRDFPSAVHFCFDHFWQWLGCAGLNIVFGTCLQTGRCQSHTTRSGAKACPMDRGVECKFGATQNMTLMHPQKTNAIRWQTQLERLLLCAGQFLSAARPTSPDRCDAGLKATRAHQSDCPRACL